MIRISRDVCRDIAQAAQLEWLETNGLGGFASSTITGMNTRRYHGLLIAATKPPAVRAVLLAKLEETLIVNGQRYELSVNQYPGTLHPQGQQYLTGFRLDPFPIFTYEVAGVRLEKTVLMRHGETTTLIEYEVKHSERELSLQLEISPLLACRDYHSLTHENSALNPAVQVEPGLAVVAPYADLPPLYLAHNASALELTGWWYRNFEYTVERARGLDFNEDLFSPVMLKFALSQQTTAALIAGTQRHEMAEASELRRSELVRRAALAATAPVADETVRLLTVAADQFLVARGTHQTVIAGYPWFTDWGRDTMIALPGLTLMTGRRDAARDILLEFARYVDQGMLPNRFPDVDAEPEYNTVDATLWFFESVRRLIEYTGDYQFVRNNLYEILQDIIAWHERGTRYGIRVDDDGLLLSGEPGVQLTWMDAKVGDWVVTPRQGKAVEIQALWYNALCVMQELAGHYAESDAQAKYKRMAALTRRSFNDQFWNQDAGCLYDVIDDERRDAAIRPNQIFAVSLAHTMLTRDKARQVVAVVARDLLTPYGLRSLAPDAPEYCPYYEGGVRERDGAYHQGTVWAWLMGPFITAYVRASGYTKKSRTEAAQYLQAFHQHLTAQACLGQVSEIFDAEAPYKSRGCFAQAWSVAELLRAAVADVYGISPATIKNESLTTAG